jgi:hypothetical protein
VEAPPDYNIARQELLAPPSPSALATGAEPIAR